MQLKPSGNESMPTLTFKNRPYAVIIQPPNNSCSKQIITVQHQPRRISWGIILTPIIKILLGGLVVWSERRGCFGCQCLRFGFCWRWWRRRLGRGRRRAAGCCLFCQLFLFGLVRSAKFFQQFFLEFRAVALIFNNETCNRFFSSWLPCLLSILQALLRPFLVLL